MRRLLLAALLLLVPGALPPADAASPRAASGKAATAQKQLRQTRAQIKALADEQKRLEDERGVAAKALREADAEVAALQRRLRATQSQVTAQEQALAGLQARSTEREAALSRQRAELAALLRSEYALGQHGQLKLLLEQNRIGELARVLAYHRYFQRHRQQRITGLQAELEELAKLGTEIAERQQQLVATRQQQEAELAALAAQRRERGGMVAKLDKRYRDRKSRLNALGRDEKNTVALLERLRKLMAQLPKPRPPARPGAKPGSKPRDAALPIGPLKLPLAGTVLAGFGGTMPDGHKSQGLLIAGSAGAQVHAARAGRVAYADWLKGYGLLMILDHGNGWMTLYAFNDALLKDTGEQVGAGEAISTVGSSGGQGRSALYFELRRNGQPQDPRSWLGKP